MEEGTKKIIIIAVLVISLIVTGVVMTRSAGNSEEGYMEVSADAIVLMKCMRPECGEIYDLSAREYYRQLDEKKKAFPMAQHSLPLTCEKCGQESVFKAVKCPQCGEVFTEGSVLNDFIDRCPKCKYSEIEKQRRNRQ